MATIYYHVSPETGRPNICRASKVDCPIGGPHFQSKILARSYGEKLNRQGNSDIPEKITKASRSVPGITTNPEFPVRARARELFALHGLNDWYFEFDNAKARLGQCDYRAKTISMSRNVIKNRPEEIEDTLLHEIAHALAGHSAGHGPVWQATARRIGGGGERTARGQLLNENEFKWFLVCPTCDSKIGRNKVADKMVGRYYCPTCYSGGMKVYLRKVAAKDM